LSYEILGEWRKQLKKITPNSTMKKGGSLLAKILKADEMNKCIGCFTCMLVCAGLNRKNHSIRKSSIHIRTSGGLSGRFVATVCHACREPHCAEVCPAGALTERKGGGVLLDPNKCIGCRRCQEACMMQAIGYDADTRQPIVCAHCGVCARYCPHGCLSMQEVEDESQGKKSDYEGSVER
jgi:Fe-S-cluster-containing dehydrogenase component